MSTMPEYLETVSDAGSSSGSDRIARYKTASTALALIGAMNIVPGIIAAVTHGSLNLYMETVQWPIYICYGLLFLPLTFLAFDGIRIALLMGLGIYIVDGVLFAIQMLSTNRVNSLAIAIRTLLVIAILQGALIRLPFRGQGDIDGD